MEAKIKTGRGSRIIHEPLAVGEILHELVNVDNSILGKSYRSYLASKEIKTKKGGSENE